MELFDAQRLAQSLMRKFRLSGWTYATNKRKKTLGLCFSQLKRIELSINFIAHNPKSIVQETILHEIAHALVGTEHGHDEVWKSKAEQIGAQPSRTTRNVTMPPGKWQATCGGCGVLFNRYRRPKYPLGNNCRRCGPDLGLLHYKNVETLPGVVNGSVSRMVPASKKAVAAHMPAKPTASKKKPKSKRK